MKPLHRGLTITLLAGGHAAQGDAERGTELLRTGDHAQAAELLRAAAEQRPDDAELAWNLALAEWGAGNAEAAEVAAEKVATLSEGRLAPLRDGLVGNLRLEAARTALAEDPERALELAGKARDALVRAARRGSGTPAFDAGANARNLERALRLIERIEEQQEQQQQEQQQQEQEQQQEQPPQPPRWWW